ncbi:HK97 family phage prohead protease [Afipia massiliensis]|uniref:HK97 family phage prohead protease n=1 Tax=Afipia massiliensis TaxID=211460 RepID=A0A840N8N4_9BRAD|nr:HK97 family phage prohead protease [Afipia massiliensis]MBB5053056.1 HK97 family phage prohead protease [Afipia massiliensis]
MDRIDVDPGILGLSEERAHRMRGNGGMKAAMYAETTKDHVIEGQALAFEEPILVNGVLHYIKTGALGATFDLDGPPVGFWIDHNKANEVGTTDDALHIVIDDKCVQFRLDLQKAKNGKLLAHLCRSGNREDISVGLDLIDFEDRVMEGQDVRIVHKARLRELSMVKSGAAGDEGFAAVVDASITPEPVAGKRSATFKATYALHKVARGLRELKAAMRGTVPASVTRSITVDMMNYWQTEETERLQSMARSRW